MSLQLHNLLASFKLNNIYIYLIEIPANTFVERPLNNAFNNLQLFCASLSSATLNYS